MWQLSSGAFLGWSLGSNDAANVFGTGVSARLVRYRTAVILIAVFVVLGASLEGSRCMATLNDLSRLQLKMAFLATLSAALVMFAMSSLALPASSSQAIVGALFAIGLMNHSADFRVFAKIVMAWVLTPVCAGVLSVILYNVLGFLLRPLLTSLRWRTPLLRTAIVIAGCYGSYTLGGNNVANVSGVYVSAGVLNPLQASIFGGLAIAAGVLTYSKKVMFTVGRGIFALDA
ncbi:inorganic phosphate transporter, partial [candidate division KSB1 bacterium]|nr:inorganic phosphate transporter [candidate division KSB1 bacterium]